MNEILMEISQVIDLLDDLVNWGSLDNPDRTLVGDIKHRLNDLFNTLNGLSGTPTKPLYELGQVVSPERLSNLKCSIQERIYNIDTDIWSYKVRFLNHRLTDTVYPEHRLKAVK